MPKLYKFFFDWPKHKVPEDVKTEFDKKRDELKAA
jgi:hypothetical protein